MHFYLTAPAAFATFLMLTLLGAVMFAAVLSYFDSHRAVANTTGGAIVQSLASVGFAVSALGALLAFGLMLRNTPAVIA